MTRARTLCASRPRSPPLECPLASPGLEVTGIRQADFGDPAARDELSSPRAGHGEGGFVAIGARRPAAWAGRRAALAGAHVL
ncbi:MAG: hypothetical protein H6711_32760 [Myxococcales bacterium]|nr:hypothetical protein [Myxococcales bacterium]